MKGNEEKEAEKMMKGKQKEEVQKKEKRNPFTGLLHNKDGSREFVPDGPVVGGANDWHAMKSHLAHAKKVLHYKHKHHHAQ